MLIIGKYRFLLGVFSALICLSFTGQVQFVQAGSMEKIDELTVEIKIDSDAVVSVTETIVYNFGDNQKHGIFRDIPLNKNGELGGRSIHISSVRVTDEQGDLRKIRENKQNNKLHIRIGEEDKLVTGRQVYRIAYQVKGAIDYLKQIDEFYWNAIGTDWQVPINKSTVIVRAPQIAQISCYVGKVGDNAGCQQQDLSNNAAKFAQNDILPGNGMTIAIGIPKGVLEQSWLDKLYSYDKFLLILPLLVLGWMWRRWYRLGKDSNGRGTIVPQWELSDKITPSEAGVVLDEYVNKADISVLFIDLAIRGYLKIKQIDKKWFLGTTDYQIVKQKEVDDKLLPFERKFLEAVFAQGDEILISELKNDFVRVVAEISNDIYNKMVEKGYFVSNPQKVRTNYLLSGLAIAGMPMILSIFINLNIWLIAAMLISGLIIVGFSFIMPRRTEKGVLLRERILGLKDYLTIAEKDRLEFHNAPKSNWQTFQKYLPYAMVLGVTDIWAKQFAQIYINKESSWYVGGDLTDVNDLVNSINKFTSTVNSATSSGSSSSGGGSVGGGSGGGGGGSW